MVEFRTNSPKAVVGLSAILILTIVPEVAFAGPWLEYRPAYYTATDSYSPRYLAGYSFDNGAGIMFTQAYNSESLIDDYDWSFSELEGWYPLWHPTDKIRIQPGGLLNFNDNGMGISGYLDVNYTFTDKFNVSVRYRYNHSTYTSLDLHDRGRHDDTHQIVTYWNYRFTDKFSYQLETDYFIKTNGDGFKYASGDDTKWQWFHKFSYRFSPSWKGYIQTGLNQADSIGNEDDYRVRLGLRYFF